MKQVKILFLFLIGLLSTFYSTTAQTTAGITKIGTISACPGTITVPLNIFYSPAVGAISLEIDFDGTVLSYLKTGGTTNIDTNLTSAGSFQASQITISGASKKLLISWYIQSENNVTIGNSGTGKICDLSFRYFGGTTSLVFNNSVNLGGNCEYDYNISSNVVTLIDTPTVAYYINGGVNTPANTASGTSPICYGSSTSLNVNAGTLIGATWKWYTISCGGTYITSGVSPVLSPTVTTTYFVRAEGICNTSTCVTANITVYTYSTAPTSVTATPSTTICPGTALTLAETGGTLGTGATWQWYTVSCGGTSVGNGTSIYVTPANTTIYYLRAEGTCNTTGCFTALVTVYTFSTTPTSVTAIPSTTICPGTALTLTETGGTLGTGAIWQWYIASCGATSVGNGTSIYITPTNTTIYYLRAEGACNTTGCFTISITVNSLSTAPTSVTANPSSTVNSGTAVTLAETGGTLGTGGKWQWYTMSCGGTSAGTGVSLYVIPTTTTNYYVRAEGTCNTTGCLTITITVNTLSTAPSSITANPSSTVCSGTAVTLTETGGTLCSGATWQWYTVSCGGTSVGNGTSLYITPVTTTNYYVRAEGTCNTTTCANIAITINTLSVVPISITASPSTTICSGTAVTLFETGGTLGTGATWQWYTVSCGGTSVGNGTSIYITPVATTNYYVRAEGTCNITGCFTISITVNSLSTAPTSVTANPSSTVSSGTAVTLSETGGTLGTGGKWQWYSISCGGTSVGTGVSLYVTPTTTTNYYVRAEGTCNTTTCANISITVNTLSTAPTSVTANPSSTVCSGTAITLTETGGTLCSGATWQWYTVSCGGTSVGNGTSLYITPVATTNYYVRAEGTCNTTTCVNAPIIVNTLSIVTDSITASPPSVCIGSSSTLSVTVTGGSLGSDAAWYWYTGMCGGTLEGIGTSINITPSTTTYYYVRAEGTCNTTACANIVITVNTLSTAPTSVTASPSTTVCSGVAASLTETGGNLGIGATWQWYTVSCGGTSAGIGTVLNITPTITSNYYVRAEGGCNTTICISKTITVNSLSSAATSATSLPSLICSGSTTTLSLTGGSLGVGGVWKWYSASCGGITRGTGILLAIAPTVTTTYYVRAQGTCNTTTCVSTIVIVNSAAATSASSSPAIITGGSSATLTESGGTLGLSSNWYWYSGSCGGTSSGTGASIIVYPTVSTLYYVRVQGTCNTTTCVNTTVTVCTNSATASSASSSSPLICSGSSTTLSFTGGILGVGGIWRWYSASCGGISKGTGLTLTTAPTVTTTYYIRAQGLCNTTTCVSTIVIVNSTAATSATASPTSIVPGSSSTLTLTGGVLGLNSNWYWYSGSCGGTYAGTGVTIVQSPTANITYFVRAEGACNPTTCVNVSVTVCSNSTPASSASGSPSAICTGSSTTLSLSGGSLGNIEIWKWYSVSCGGISRGTGVNLILFPTVTTIYYVRAQGTCNTTTCVSTTVIVNSSPAASATASPSVINPGASTTLTENSGILNPGSTWRWYSSSCGGTFIKTGVSIVQSPTVTCLYYVRSENSSCSPSTCVSVTVTVNSTKSYQYNNISEKNENALNNELIVYPNPAKDKLNISYNIVKNGRVKIELYNLLGEKVEEILNQQMLKGKNTKEIDLSELSSGVYACKMVLDDNSIIVKRLVISK